VWDLFACGVSNAAVIRRCHHLAIAMPVAHGLLRTAAEAFHEEGPMKARRFTYVLGGMAVLLIGPAAAQTTGTGSSGAPAAGSGAASPAPTTPKPPATPKPGPTPSGTTSVETAPSQGVPGTPQRPADPLRPRGASPDTVGLSDAQQVRNLQQALKDRGMHPGPVDGVVSPETQAAIRAFQERQKVPVTGRLDSRTREKLGMSP
jgi:hypothetical protein